MSFLRRIKQALADQDCAIASEDSVLGRIGSVSVTIPDKGLGEVRVNVRGTTEAYSARAASGQTIAEGIQIVVVEHSSPRTVAVEPMTATRFP